LLFRPALDFFSLNQLLRKKYIAANNLLVVMSQSRRQKREAQKLEKQKRLAGLAR
jgi:hypothetical protein